MKAKTVPALMPTRKARRARAKSNMFDVPHLFKRTTPRGDKRESYFSLHWREAVAYDE